MAYLDDTGLAYFWGKIKAWANSVFALISHTHSASDVTLMTGYSKPASGSAIAASDTLNQAVGKLEAKTDAALDDSNYVHITGDETITGFKTIKATSYNTSAGKASGFHLRHPNITRGDSYPAADSQRWLSIVFGDASGDLDDKTSASGYGRLGLIELAHEPYRQMLIFSAYRPSSNLSYATEQSQLKVGFEYESSADAGIPFGEFNGCFRFTRTTDASGTQNNHPAIIVGTETGNHLEIDSNEIMAKSDGTTPTDLYINGDGGTTTFGGLVHATSNLKLDNTLYGTSATKEVLLYADPDYTHYGGGKIALRGSGMSGSTTAGSIAIIASDSSNAQCSVQVNTVQGLVSSHNIISPYIHVKGVNPYISFVETDISKGVSGGNGWQGIRFFDKNASDVGANGSDSNYMLGYIIQNSAGPSNNSLQFCAYSPVSGTANGCSIDFGYSGGSSTSNIFFYNSSHDNVVKLGSGVHRWAVVYAGTGSINTSDARLKSDISDIPDNVLDAWAHVGWRQFKMNDAVEEKGNLARLHSGAIAQEIAAAFEAAGLDPSRYALYCYDRWEAREEQKNAKGETVVGEWPAGDRYSLRYEEALCMEAAYQRRENARLKKRVADLEARLASLELRLGSE